MNMSKVEYNGWANYETWAVHLLLSNSEHLYTAMIDTNSEEELAELAVACIDPSEGIEYGAVDWSEIYAVVKEEPGE